VFTFFAVLSASLAQIPPGPALPPSVKLGNITFSIENPLEGETLQIQSSITSNQTIPLSNLTVHLLIDQVEIGNITDVVLEPMENKSIIFDWEADKWTHVIMLSVEQGSSPIPGAIVIESITVEAKPVGDLKTLIFYLVLISIFILGITVSPSLIAHFRS
jgi:hypothetical protein